MLVKKMKNFNSFLCFDCFQKVCIKMRLLFVLFGLFLLTFGKPVTQNSTGDTETECKTCETLVELFRGLWGDATIEDCSYELMIYVCQAMHVSDHFVCKGLVSDFKETFKYVVKEVLKDPAEACGIVIKGCNGSFPIDTATWFLPIPDGKPEHKEPNLPEKGKPILKVLHLSDLHIDNEYLIGAEAKCGEMMCCRPAGDNDAGKDTVSVPAGKWGTYGSCDSPYWLVEDLMKHISVTHKDLDNVVVSGDLESHADWGYTREGHQEKIRNVTRLMKKYLPGVNIYFAQGNHESVPLDAFAPSWTPEEYHMDWMYGTEADEWSDWLPEESLATVRFNGCYMKKLFPGLRLISLNNILGNPYNVFLYINQTDPDGTLTWLISQLLDAEKAGDKVQIVAHIPGGSMESLEGWSLNYYKAVNRFEDTIVAQFFGHTHFEDLNVYYEDLEDPKSRPTAVVYSAGSITPNFAFNPSYRIYKIDGNYANSSFQILDWETHFLNLTTANANPEAPTNWEILYPSVKAEYDLNSLAPAEWSNLIIKMIKNDTLYSNYHKNRYRRDHIICHSDCRRNTLCTMRTGHHTNKMCNDIHPTTGINGKYDVEQKSVKETKSEMPKSKNDILTDFKEAMAKLKTIVKDDSKCPV